MTTFKGAARIVLLSAALFLLVWGRGNAEPRVVADIAPVHSIVSRVMEGVGEPELLLAPGVSPHDYALRPSQARSLETADLVVWTGAGLTPWLERPLASLSGAARILAADDIPGVVHLPVRVGAVFAGVSEADGAGGHRDERIAGEAAADGHDHAGDDPHVWLDPDNAAAIAEATAEILADLDPADADAYATNARAFADDLSVLSGEIAQELAAYGDARIIVYHDAFQYFEHRFGLTALASVVAQEGVPPSAARISSLRELLGENAVTCAFTEPQFDAGLLRTVVEGLPIRIADLDPLGAGLAPGPVLYPDLLRDLSRAIADCLEP